MRSLAIAAVVALIGGCSLNFGGGDDGPPGDDTPPGDIMGCEWNGQFYQPGELFPYGDGCNTCQCDAQALIGCTAVACPSCEAEPGCLDGPACGDGCCGPGEYCDGDECKCGDGLRCSSDEACVLVPGQGPPGCGLYCCRPGEPCPPEPSSCLPEGACAGPMCGGSCCGAGEHCDGGECRCGLAAACLPGDTCSSGGPVAPAGPTFCGSYCCGDLHGCPI